MAGAAVAADPDPGEQRVLIAIDPKLYQGLNLS